MGDLLNALLNGADDESAVLAMVKKQVFEALGGRSAVDMEAASE